MRSEKKQTAINLIAKIISYGTTYLIAFFLTPYLVEKIGSEAYSFYPIANNFTSYMSIITIALNSMASRFITIALTKNEKKKANTYFASIFFGNVFMSALLLIPMTIIVIFLDSILNIPLDLIISIKLLFSLVFISMIINLLTNVFGVSFFSQNRIDLNSICDIVIGITRVVLYIILFLFFEPSIIYVGIVAFVVALLTFFLQFSFSKQLLPEMKISFSFFDRNAIKEVFSSGIWNSVNQVGTVLMSTIGLFMCNTLYGSVEAGVYSVALTIPSFMNGIVSMLCSTFLPTLTIKYALGDRKEILNHVHITQSVVGIIDCVPIAVFMAVGSNFFKLWTPSVDNNKVQVLSMFAIGYLLVTSVSWPLSNLNIVMNRVKIPALVMLGTGVINIILILFTYYFTDIGVYSIPLGQMLLFILNRGTFIAIYTAKSMNEKWYYFYPPILKNLLGAGVIFLISYLVNIFVNPQNWLIMFLECFFLGIVGLLINMFIVLKASERGKIIKLLSSKIFSRTQPKNNTK